MPIYVVVGQVSADRWDGIPLRWWPVLYCVDPADATRTKETCEAQRDLFLEELRPIWAGYQEAKKLDSSYGSSYRISNGRSKRRPDVQQVQAAEARYRKERDRLSKKEAEITSRWAEDMLDPLFPTSTNGHEPASKIVYKIVEIWEDPREMGPAAILKLRAALHGGATEDDETPDDDD